MTLQTHRPAATIMALALTAACWLPTLAETPAQARTARPYVVATPPSVVLM
jgi:hypothetical protein